ncbi:MAG: hypothetical protein IJG97_06280 [Bacilli bacterium]|nr:hypothetical protein [Bacilli bacterium]MBQ6497996.1 hypothetical protein [Bacilli bacterium]
MKLNNKGFAITTLIYGLSIMGMMLMTLIMSVMAINRANNRQLSQQIEEDLNRYNRTSTTFRYISTEQSYRIPSDEGGWYRIELWGASGSGGLGAYTSGIIELKADDYLYFNIGKSGVHGGSTDVRIVPKSKAGSDNSRIMVAAGGGSESEANGGTLAGYNASMIPAGGIVDSNYNLTTSSKTLVGYSSYAEDPPNLFTDTPSPTPQNDGGGGYYSAVTGRNGGKSYIAGYAGCIGYDQANGWSHRNPGLYTKVTQYDVASHANVLVNKMFYFVDGVMFAGVNRGDGKAKLERVVKKNDPSQTLKRTNTELNGVKRIVDCVEGPSLTGAATISAVSKGIEYASQTASFDNSTNCTTVTVNGGAGQDLDEIAVWHGAGVDYVNHTIMVDNANGNNRYLKKASNDSSAKLSETETAVGYRISAYQPNYTNYLPMTGNYYLLPVLSENKALTAISDITKTGDQIGIANINGLKTQKWNVELITDKDINPDYVANNPSTYQYKIIDASRFYALSIAGDTSNREKNGVRAYTEFNKIATNDIEIWKIVPLGNGTYTISTIKTPAVKGTTTGNLFAQLDPDKDHYEKILIGKNNKSTQRFRLISVDYSST